MALAKPDDPYVTNDGKVLTKSNGKDFNAFDTQDTSTGAGVARNHKSSARRSIADMPVDPKTQTAIMVVLTYSLLGLSENEIASTVGITIQDVRKLKSIDAYQETFDLLFWEMIHANGQSLVAKIAKAAPGALQSVIDIANDGENENAKYKAAADILDRSGLHHEALFGKAASDGLDGLKIIIKQADEDKTEVNINLRR